MSITRAQIARQLYNSGGISERQDYGFGSFVKKLTKKVTKPFTKVSKKIVPKELAGIMRVAAPFMGPVAGPLAYLAGTAKQTGRISPLDLALIAAPKIGNIKFAGDQSKYARFVPEGLQGKSIKQALGETPLPFTDKNLREVLVGKGSNTRKIIGRQDKYGDSIAKPYSEVIESYESLPQTEKDRLDSILTEYNNADIIDVDPESRRIGREFFNKPAIPTTIYEPETAGLFGKGGKMFKFGKDDMGILDTKAGQALFGKTVDGKPTGEYSLKKIGGYGLGAYSYFQNKKMIEELQKAQSADEAGQTLVDLTGDPDAYQKGVELFGQLDTSAFDIPEQFRLADGGRVNYALGSRPTAEESGLGGLPIEADMRYTGGFMPYGAVEKADDVPARLSKNEFVFTADAVRAAGGGSVNEGAKRMYDMMKNLESQPEAKGAMA